MTWGEGPLRMARLATSWGWMESEAPSGRRRPVVTGEEEFLGVELVGEARPSEGEM